MGAGLLQAIYQERRRLYFVTLSAFVAGVLFYAHIDIELAGLPAPFVVGLVYAFVIGIAATIVCLLAPSFRFMLEAIAISRLCVAWIAFSAPGVGHVVISSPILNACIVVGFGVGVSRLIHGRVARTARRSLRDRLYAYARDGRAAPKVEGHAWQRRYVAWIDAAPAAA